MASLTLARLATLAVWLAGGAVVVYWGLKLLAWSSSAAAPAPVTPPLPVAEEASVARLLGAAPGPAAAAAPSSRAQLTLAGVVARADTPDVQVGDPRAGVLDGGADAVRHVAIARNLIQQRATGVAYQGP